MTIHVTTIAIILVTITTVMTIIICKFETIIVCECHRYILRTLRSRIPKAQMNLVVELKLPFLRVAESSINHGNFGFIRPALPGQLGSLSEGHKNLKALVSDRTKALKGQNHAKPSSSKQDGWQTIGKHLLS